MRSARAKAAAAPLAVLGSACLMLTACTADKGSEQAPASPTATQTQQVEVSDSELATAMDRLVHHGDAKSSPDKGVCFAKAVQGIGVSDVALTHLVENDGDDLVTLAEELREAEDGKLADDAELLLSTQLRSKLDLCVDDQVEPIDSDTKYTPPKPVKPADEGKPNLKPKHKIDKDEQIRSPRQLEPGVKTMFASFAQDEAQKEIYERSTACLAETIFDSDLSQESLHFIAGGAPIGAGSIAEHLANDDDKEIWRSTSFTTGLTDCTEAKPDTSESPTAAT